MNKIILTICGLFLFTNLKAQIGIGITMPDASARLEVNSNNKGMLIPPITLTSTTDAITIPLPASGLMVYTTNITAITPGFYINYGTPAAPVWKTFIDRISNQYNFSNLYSLTASAPVEVYNVSKKIIDNANLGMSLSVTIPANSDVRVIVNYSIPLGIISGEPGGYMGIRFLKNSIEGNGGSRKVSISPLVAGVGNKMSTISAAFIDVITNNTSTDVTETYALNGYMEVLTTEAGNFRFNMWSRAGSNFNWGHGNPFSTGV